MKTIGILGASSLVGHCVLQQLNTESYQIFAYSRQLQTPTQKNVTTQWQNFNDLSKQPIIHHWICLAPIWSLSHHFQRLEKAEIKRIIVLSSTSIISKQHSTDPKEIETIQRLKKGEQQLQQWANKHQIDFVILRPTLIYGLGRDKNISEIIRFIKRFHCFPILGQAQGLRQPVHAEDVANACVTLIKQTNKPKQSLYTVSGGSILSYRTMIEYVFKALNKKTCLLPIPLTFFNISINWLRKIPRYQQWSVTMVERMNQDLVFDHHDATRDFSYQPRPFLLADVDIY